MCPILSGRQYEVLYKRLGPKSSLSTGYVPFTKKLAAVNPILKKPWLDLDSPIKYRPISNLPFLLKVLERVQNLIRSNPTLTPITCMSPLNLVSVQNTALRQLWSKSQMTYCYPQTPVPSASSCYFTSVQLLTPLTIPQSSHASKPPSALLALASPGSTLPLRQKAIHLNQQLPIHHSPCHPWCHPRFGAWSPSLHHLHATTWADPPPPWPPVPLLCWQLSSASPPRPSLLPLTPPSPLA